MYKTFALKISIFIYFLNSESQAAESFKTLEKPTSFRRNFKPIELIPWHWKCDPNTQKCKRFNINSSLNKDKNDSFHYLEGCKSVCGQFGSIWPRPTGETVLKPILKAFQIEDVAVKIDPKGKLF